MVDLVRVEAAVQQVVDRRGEPVAVARARRRDAALADDADLGDARAAAARSSATSCSRAATCTSFTSARKTNGPSEIAAIDSARPRLLSTA